MKRSLAILCAVLMLLSCAGPDDGPDSPSAGPGLREAAEYLFDPDCIPEIHIRVSDAEWKRLLQEYDARNSTKEYIRCDALLIKGDDEYDIPEAGLRLRGNTSRRRPEDGNGRMQHCHYSLDFNHFHDNPYHSVRGIRHVDLKWFKDDPAYVREVYCYDLFRRFGVWTAVRDIHARLWIQIGTRKEAYLGVYGMLEHIGRDYLDARAAEFGTTDGFLWKCSYGADLRRANNDFAPDDKTRDHVYELKTRTLAFEEARAQLQDFIKKLNEYQGDVLFNWLNSVTDVDLLLKTYAVNVAVGMWDDYWNNTNNYYLYFTPHGKMYFIPFDYDNTLGTSINCGVQNDSGRQDPLHWGSDDNPLMTKILQNRQWHDDYKRYLRELTVGNGLSSPSEARTRIIGWQGRIDKYISNDTGEDMKMNDRPASWSNHHEYRLKESGANNFFLVKSQSVASME